MTQALQLLLSLMILIVLHEMGHFIPAKLFKTRVEKFYLFFDPWFALFKVKKGETEYGIGWLPLGGYVKIAGMIDESMDKEQMKKPPEPWEFRSKPTWQRLIIMLGGVTVNLFLGIFIYWMVLFAWGKETLPVDNVKYGIVCDSLALKMGLKDGDKILSVDNKSVTNFQRIPVAILLDQAKTIQVDRDGQKVEIKVTEENLSELMRSQKTFVSPRFPCFVESFIDSVPAAKKAGLKIGDHIIGVNGLETPYANDVTKNIHENKGKTVELKVLRGNDTAMVNVAVNKDGLSGFVLNDSIKKFFKTDKVNYTLLSALPAAFHEGYEKVVMQIKTFSVIFSVKGAHKSLGGFYSIAKAYDAGWDWQVFWTFTAFLSIVLAFMNLLPIPALDGGHVMFLLYEMITRRKPNEKAMEYAQYAGMLLLLTLMVYANTDWLRR